MSVKVEKLLTGKVSWQGINFGSLVNLSKGWQFKENHAILILITAHACLHVFVVHVCA